MYMFFLDKFFFLNFLLAYSIGYLAFYSLSQMLIRRYGEFFPRFRKNKGLSIKTIFFIFLFFRCILV